jgi:hypothetical protein
LSYTKLSYSNYSVNFIRAHGLIQVKKYISSNPAPYIVCKGNARPEGKH